jgi:long-chain acyl-CoA synthetase
MPQAAANIAETILAAGRPEAAAIVYGDEEVTYGALRRMVEGCAAGLLAGGLEKGDRVGLLAENGPFFAAAYLGVMRAGLCAVPLQVDLGEAALAAVVRATGMKRLYVSRRFLPKIEPLGARLGVEPAVESPDLFSAPAAAPPPPHEIDPRRDLAAVMLTSGSTGEPKGVMVTHRNIACNTRDIIEYMDLRPDDRVMAVLPFYYCYGASLLHTHLAAGGSLVVNNRFMFPEKVLDEMDRRGCTGLAGVPSTYQILLRKTRFARRSFPSLRWMQQAGGRLPSALIREIREAFPRVKFFVMYGQTEATARLSYLPPERLDEKLGSIGRGLRSTRLEVLREDGEPVRPGTDAASAEVGEIVAAGENVCPGYWNDPEETARYFRGGKLYTGDMAWIDPEGHIYVVDRARDFIKAMGNRLSPQEIEEVLAEMPEIVEAAVVGTPDEIWGEAPMAFVVAARPGGLTAGQVRAYCLKREMPNYKIPARIEFLPQLPKTANGKVARDALKRLVDGTGS